MAGVASAELGRSRRDDSMDVKSLAVEAMGEPGAAARFVQGVPPSQALVLRRPRCAINSGQGSIWSHLASDAGLSQAMRSWNAVTVRIMSSKVAAFERR